MWVLRLYKLKHLPHALLQCHQIQPFHLSSTELSHSQRWALGMRQDNQTSLHVNPNMDTQVYFYSRRSTENSNPVSFCHFCNCINLCLCFYRRCWTPGGFPGDFFPLYLSPGESWQLHSCSTTAAFCSGRRRHLTSCHFWSSLAVWL